MAEDILNELMLNNPEPAIKRLRKLTLEEKERICEEFMIPYNGIDIVLENANKEIRKIAMDNLEDIMIYPEIVDEFREHLSKKFQQCLIEAKTPIGAITSDAIGQQSMQAVLNTFHNVGTVKSGGPEGIKENISISKERKIVYSEVHFKNSKLTYKDVMAMKSKFIGATITSLLAKPAESKIINIVEELRYNVVTITDEDTRKRIMLSDRSWWYIFHNHILQHVYNQSVPGSDVRKCLRLTFDKQKLYEFNLTIPQIAEFVNKWVFKITHPKSQKEQGSSSTTRKTSIQPILAIPSPTAIGIIDIYVKSYTPEADHFLISLLHEKEFDKMIISGIEGITNFYAVSGNVVRLLRDVSSTTKEDEEKGKRGMWVYLTDNQFIGIPYQRMVDYIEAAGLPYEEPSYGTPLKTPDGITYTSSPIEYSSSKLIPELRKEFSIRAYLYGNMTEHKLPTYSLPVIYNGIITKEKQIIECKNDHYTYRELKRGKEVVLFQHSESKEKHNGIPIFKNKLKNKHALVKMMESYENRITQKKLMDGFFPDQQNSDLAKQYMQIFLTETTSPLFIGFELEENNDHPYVYFYMIQHRYIDYRITVNLDYVNSRFVTQSLDSVLISQFSVPFNLSYPEGGVMLPDTFRHYRVFDVVREEEPLKRILIKSKMFLTDKYDYLGDPEREEKLKGKDTKLKPKDRLIKYLKDNAEEKHGTYVYAETTGTNLPKLLTMKVVEGSKTFCNHYHQTWGCLGLEAMRRLLTYDMVSMINSSGYISVSYINIETNVITHNGANPMTSAGISCQKRSVYDMVTFDNAGAYILNAATIGKEQGASTTSTCIFLGKRFEVGTGSVEVRINRARVVISNRKNGISEGFLRLTGMTHYTDNLFLPDSSDAPIIIPEVQVGKFPRVSWMIDRYVNKDLVYYMQNGIDQDKRARGINQDKRAQFYYAYRSRFNPDSQISKLFKRIPRQTSTSTST